MTWPGWPGVLRSVDVSDCEVARSPQTALVVLRRLANDRQAWLVRAAVAGNPKTPPDVLERLSKDQAMPVRRAVAGNPKTPPEVLERLAKDLAWLVRAAVAGNAATTTAHVVTQLLHDPLPEVREAVPGSSRAMWQLVNG